MLESEKAIDNASGFGALAHFSFLAKRLRRIDAEHALRQEVDHSGWNDGFVQA